uniref:Chemosensory protein 1 n=1 Tax=Bactrocera minax TaxID=104690 RepID=A0A3G2LEF4_9MUSC|nr:chemosensory protein 1 [Bactrocera minax]
MNMNMKQAALIFFIVVTVQCGTAQKQYTNKFDNVDVDGVLSNNRILTNYIKCLMDKGPCTPEGRYCKSVDEPHTKIVHQPRLRIPVAVRLAHLRQSCRRSCGKTRWIL